MTTRAEIDAIRERLMTSGAVAGRWDAADMLLALADERDALRKDAERWRALEVTFMDVDHAQPTRAPNVPVLSCVSKRIWYHATDDTEHNTLAETMDALIAKRAALAPVEPPADARAGERG
jgi:hypothetical protein